MAGGNSQKGTGGNRGDTGGGRRLPPCPPPPPLENAKDGIVLRECIRNGTRNDVRNKIRDIFCFVYIENYSFVSCCVCFTAFRGF